MNENEIKELSGIFPQLQISHLMAIWKRENGDHARIAETIFSLEYFSEAEKEKFFVHLEMETLPPLVSSPVVIPEPEPAPVPVPEPVIVERPPIVQEQIVVVVQEPEPEPEPEPVMQSESSSSSPDSELLTFSKELEEKFVTNLLKFENLEMDYAKEAYTAWQGDAACGPLASIIIQNKEQKFEEKSTDISNFLSAMGLKLEEIRFVTTSVDPAIIQSIVDTGVKFSESEYPLLCLFNSHYFTYPEFQSKKESGDIATLINSKKFTSSGEYYGQTILDVLADTTNSLVYNLAWILTLPISLPYNWLMGSKPIEKKPEEVDFSIVHTNWYWRNLKQKIRFGLNQFYRMDTEGYSILTASSYDSISSITIVNPTYFFISYRPEESRSADYISAPEADCNTMIDLIKARGSTSGREIPVIRISEIVPAKQSESEPKPEPEPEPESESPASQ